MSASHRIPADSYLWTTAGPQRTADLLPGHSLAVIDSHGRVATSLIRSAVPVGDEPGFRLLTTAGDICVVAGTVLTTRAGRLFHDVAAERIRGGEALRIEIADPKSLPTEDAQPTAHSLARHALALMDDAVIRVPTSLGLDSRIVELLEVAETRYVRVPNDQWTIFTFDQRSLRVSSSAAVAAEADVLMTLTGWRHSRVAMCSRTRLEQTRTRGRLLATLAVGGAPAAVQWQPGYGPVVAHVVPGASTSFATAKFAIAERTPCVELTLADSAAVISNLAVLTTRATTKGD